MDKLPYRVTVYGLSYTEQYDLFMSQLFYIGYTHRTLRDRLYYHNHTKNLEISKHLKFLRDSEVNYYILPIHTWKHTSYYNQEFKDVCKEARKMERELIEELSIKQRLFNVKHNKKSRLN